MGSDRDSRTALVVVTRDRASVFERCLLGSLASVPAGEVAVVVVDQSENDATARMVQGLDGVRYLRAGPGLSSGRNAGVRAVRAPLILFTDDDVEFGPGWLDEMSRTFDRFPRAGAVCGSGQNSEGRRLPGCVEGEYEWPANPFALGSGFNFAFRREALAQAGPFDEDLGAGARFRSAEDTDMLYRVMREGWSVVCAGGAGVVHHSWRPRRAIPELFFGYGVGVGAQSAKHLSAGDWTAGRFAAQEAARHLTWLVHSLARGKSFAVLLHIFWFLGLLSGLARRAAACASS